MLLKAAVRSDITKGKLLTARSLDTCAIKGPMLFFRVRIFPRDFSMIDGKASSLRVCPVGAVSNTTTLKSIVLTNLEKNVIAELSVRGAQNC